MESEFIRCWREPDDGNHTRVYYNITNNQWNCAEHYGHCNSCPKLQGDPDIAGIGVFIAFMVSVSLTAVLGIIFPVLSAALRPRATAIHDCLDILLEKAVRKTILKRLGIQKAERWASICYNSVFSLGDQQLTTAFALLVATLKKLYSDQSLSVYHLKLIMNLACLSHCVYAYTIISWRIKKDLKPIDRAEAFPAAPRQVKNKPMVVDLSLRLRSILMFTVTALLLYTGWIAARVDGLKPNCPALCFKNIPAKGEAAKVWTTQYWIPIYYTLVISFTQCLAVVRRRKRSGCVLQKKNKATTKNTSNLFEIFGVCGNVLLAHAFFIYYLYRVGKSWRERNRSWYAADIQNEQSWGFGQIVPLLLLIQPVLQLFDSISEAEEETEVHDRVERGTQTESRFEHDEVENGLEGRSFMSTPRNTI